MREIRLNLIENFISFFFMNSSTWSPDDNIDEDDDGNDMTLTISGREGTIYLIDANLFADVEQFRLCLQCIEASMLSKILTNHKDLVSYNLGDKFIF